MLASRQHKISGSQLESTLPQLRNLCSSVKESPQSNPTPTHARKDQLDTVIDTLESRVNNLLESFSTPNDDALERLKIVFGGVLRLHPDATLRKAIDASRSAGSDKLWSNDYLYKHLSFLTNSFTNMNGSSRMVIETFFFRSTAMIPSPQELIMISENQVLDVHPRLLQTDTTSAIINHTAIMILAKSSIADMHICFPKKLDKCVGDNVIVFFAVEIIATTGDPIFFGDHFSQVTRKLVACAKELGKSHIRGVITTGFQWCFLVVDLDPDGNGAKYWVSVPIEWRIEQGRREYFVKETSNKFDPALIAGILSSWIPESFEEFNGDQFMWQVGIK